MSNLDLSKLQNATLIRRIEKTLKFLTNSEYTPKTILDIAENNIISELMRDSGFKVENTTFDLDLEPELLNNYSSDAVTIFEVLEHLINPAGVLKNLNSDHLFASIPLDLWFAKAYRNDKDLRDRHFHEFEDWQFEWLLDYSGWKIIRYEKWTSYDSKIGIRPILRRFTPRYYMIEAIRK